MELQAQPQRILLPAKVSFIVLTVALALLFNLLPWRNTAGVPDLTAAVLAFWCIHQPRRVGIGIAWTLGLLLDVGNGALLGQHALGYSVLAFLAFAVHRRILWFPLWQQALHLLLLLLVDAAADAGDTDRRRRRLPRLDLFRRQFHLRGAVAGVELPAAAAAAAGGNDG